jgi:biotin-dependent carboxylase-like uncharacterized protein
MLGNCQNDAALEMTLFGLEIVFGRECCVVLAGAGLAMNVDGICVPPWTVGKAERGSRLEVTGFREGRDGCRSYLCFSGGIDVPPVMGSRSTYTRGKIGGYKGRALRAGDVVNLREPRPLWRLSAGFVCPPELRPSLRDGEFIGALDGPQIDAFTDAGIKTFFNEPYTVTNEIDRMGYRLDGPAIEHASGPDVVSDGIVHGSVQVPGEGKPIVLMADRQTTGGYAKIAAVSTWSVARLAQKMPGDVVRFKRISEKEAAAQLFAFEENLRRLDDMRAAYRSRPRRN